MKFTATTVGDHSVGIDDEEYVLELVGWTPDRIPEDHRQAVKEAFKELVDTLSDTITSWVIAEDECPDCGSRGYKDAKCGNDHCIQNIPEDALFGEQVYADILRDEFRHSE